MISRISYDIEVGSGSGQVVLILYVNIARGRQRQWSGCVLICHVLLVSLLLVCFVVFVCSYAMFY